MRFFSNPSAIDKMVYGFQKFRCEWFEGKNCTKTVRSLVEVNKVRHYKRLVESGQKPEVNTGVQTWEKHIYIFFQIKKIQACQSKKFFDGSKGVIG